MYVEYIFCPSFFSKVVSVMPQLDHWKITNREVHTLTHFFVRVLLTVVRGWGGQRYDEFQFEITFFYADNHDNYDDPQTSKE